MKDLWIKSFDNEEICCYLWDDVRNPKGIVQIFHGMAEHARRYDDFAKFLNKQGYIVFADDHRGHGRTAKEIKLGVYKGKNIFKDTLKDEIFFSQWLKNEYKLPLYVFGHSYGSFIAQAYITQCNLYDKLILSGSALMKNKGNLILGLIIAWFANIFFKNKPAKFIEKVNFYSYQKLVKEGSWLNSDENEVKKYYADGLNGFTLSNKFYFNMFNAFRHMYKKTAINNIDKNKPIFLIAGQNDPVGDMSRSVKDLHKFYQSIGLENVEIKIYSDARHEILNEPKIKQTVYQDVLNFIKK